MASLNFPAQLAAHREINDPKFKTFYRRYLFQAGLGTAAILAVLLFTDSLSDAALAAALGSSVVIILFHPGSHGAKARSLIGLVLILAAIKPAPNPYLKDLI